MKLYERLQKTAGELGIKQIDLCKKLGIPKTTINGYFKGTREPDIETLKLLAQALNTTVGYLMGETTPTTITTEEFLAQQGITNPAHIASLLNIMELMKTDSESDYPHNEYLKKESSMKQAN